MERVEPNTVASKHLSAGRLLRAGLLAAVFSAVANALVLVMASALFGTIVVPPDEPLTFGQVVVASAVGAIAAATVFAIVGQLARRPTRTFLILAGAVLLLSFLPIFLLGATGPSAWTLVLMHIVAAAIVIGLFMTAARKR
jgi:hypothetical protein